MPDKSLHSRHFQGPSERDVTTNNGLSTTQPAQPRRAAAVRLPGVANRRWGVDVGQFEPLAQAIHERWRQEAIANGETAPTWQDLDESRKNSSRDQARHLPVHLPKVGSALAPLRDSEARDFTSLTRKLNCLPPPSTNAGTVNAPPMAGRWPMKRMPNGRKRHICRPWKQLKNRYPGHRRIRRRVYQSNACHPRFGGPADHSHPRGRGHRRRMISAARISMPSSLTRPKHERRSNATHRRTFPLAHARS
jgi:hypothetical protein